jgi:hypothetical protein
VTTADVLGSVLLVVWVLAAAWSARTGRIWPLGALGIGYLVP